MAMRDELEQVWFQYVGSDRPWQWLDSAGWYVPDSEISQWVAEFMMEEPTRAILAESLDDPYWVAAQLVEALRVTRDTQD